MTAKRLKAHEQRVVAEKNELDERLTKLMAFTSAENFGAVVADPQERDRLVKQQGIMMQLSQVLGERIAAFKSDEE